MTFRWFFESSGKMRGYTEIKSAKDEEEAAIELTSLSSDDIEKRQPEEKQMSLDYPLVNWATESALGISACCFYLFQRCRQRPAAEPKEDEAYLSRRMIGTP